MKRLHLFSALLLSFFLLSAGACAVHKKDNGKHKGWFKNPKNPHNPANPGKTTGNGNSGKKAPKK
jgi:hypothetical protein